MKLLTQIITIFSLLFCLSVFAKTEKNTVIINNEATSSTESSNNQQTISAPALVPSEAKKLRSFRERQEIKTEDSILKELEKQRLLDEQKRVDKLLGKTKESVSTSSDYPSKTSLRPVLQNWIFGRKAFISFGAGAVTYYQVGNINSYEYPALFTSFGAYSPEGFMIFEFSAYYSKHYIRTPLRSYTNFREMVDQPALAMAIKLTPFNGRVKPYVGISGSIIARKWDVVTKDGVKFEDITINPNLELLRKDVANKDWYLSFDAGLALGADLALGESLGLNVDLRYHLNLHTENRKTVYQFLSYTEILDERDSLIFSANLRYYFH
ncbi:MAG: hypothetical protein OXC37_01420 [Bdellovibrionaceae bacterium]|nr:hypothetical protein [Pseudobdellovibrionaceae bacterium]